MSFLKKYFSHFLIVCIGFLYFQFGYFLDRTNFTQLLSLYSGLFFLSFLLYQREKDNVNFLAEITFLFRLIFLFSIPNLSQDFYRFIWDGRMILEGFNPYISLPENFIQKGDFPISQAQELYNGMGELNGSHFTNYPPINQLNFLMASIFSDANILGSVIILRLQIILADLGIFYFGRKMLKSLNLPERNLFLYLLNPFIIIELTGNLHFESVMLFFLVWSMYLLLQRKWIWASILLGCSVSVKLIPLILIPVFFQWFFQDRKWNQIIQFLVFGGIAIIVNILLFLPFLSEDLMSSYTDSVGLWFTKFEFNASIYYIAREIGYWFTGYNQIAIIGKILSIVSFVMILSFSFLRKNQSPKRLLEALLLVLTCYYFLSTTVHPWYLASLVLLGCFTRFRFPSIWSFMVILTYQAYANLPWQENLWLVSLEYLIVFGVLLWELKERKLQ